MDLRYEAFCFADPLFFDEQRATDTAEDSFANDLPEPPQDWIVADHGMWHTLRPVGVALPAQGWKIHVSTTLDTAANVLVKLHDYCIGRKIAFKYLRTTTILLIQNSKYCGRESSGKFVTIYPVDDQAFHEVLEDLSTLLANESGPYILSDLRYGSVPLYVRYGGFTERWVDHAGARVAAIAEPDGTLVPDRREPKFYVPDWVELPDCLKPQLAARRTGDPAQFPYQVTRPLHFSNGGGVYLATRNSDGAQLVLKEARPHAGLDRAGTDAIARLHREHDTLRLLAGIPGVPQVYDLFDVWEHEFLAMQFVPGRTLGKWMGLNYPLSRHNRTRRDVEQYTGQALRIVGEVAALLDRMHQRGLVYGDLHGGNVLVDPPKDEDADGDGTGRWVSLIDFELAHPTETAVNPGLGAAGFRPMEPRSGVEVDEYALAALRLWLFLPLNTVLELAPDKLDSYLAMIESTFPLPAGYTDSIRAQLTPRTARGQRCSVQTREIEQPAPDWELVGKSVADAILASATPQRRDRLFPGDIEQFSSGGACFGVGAAGVLHALRVAGFGRYPEHERWLLDAVRRDPPTRPGFGDGACGIAYVLENLGYRDAADELLDGTAGLVEQTTEHDLNGGLAGIGLTQLHLAATRGDGPLRLAREAAERLASMLDTDTGPTPTGPPPVGYGRAGLLHGWSGPSVLFTRLHARTGEPRWLELADRALLRDLRECIPATDGSLQVRDRTRTLPYVGIGSAGILMAAELLAEHVESLPAELAAEPEAPRRIPELRAACRGEFCVYPGLMFGRAGLLAALGMGQRRAPDPTSATAIDEHRRGLGLYAVPYRDRIAFVGTTQMRLSMDLNTGGAGVLLALTATPDGTGAPGAALPFLEPTGVQSPKATGQP